PSPKFSLSIPLGNVITSFYPEISDLAANVTLKSRAALRWYVKGLAATFEVDRFIFFWIALEILWAESGVSIEEPSKCAKCGLEIKACTDCGRPTTRQVRGASIQKYLTSRLGVDSQIARELWRFRQLVHGSNKLRYEDLTELPRLILHLRSATNSALK